MGDVYAAEHGRWGYRVAIKVVQGDRALDRGALDAFDAEIRAVARLDSPHVVRILDQGIAAGGERWFAMDRAAGALDEPPPEWPALLAALDHLLQGLAAAHGQGILHLDVKPSNILVHRDGRHVLADFGIALLRDAGADGGVRYGSVAYLAPERFDCRAERLTESTDLYAVGAVAWQLAHRAPPFVAASWTDAGYAHRTVPVPPMRPRIPVPPGFEGWVRALLAKRPGDRPTSAAAARSALLSLASERAAVMSLPTAWPEADPAALTLTATAASEELPVEELFPTAAPLHDHPLPERWPRTARPRRPESVGLGLLGLLAVPFWGRDAEREALWQALREAHAGGGPVRVGLAGPLGVGRTRLGEALAAAAVEHGGAAVLHVPGRSGGPVQALRTWLGLTSDAVLAEERRVREAVALRLAVMPGAPVATRVWRALHDDEGVGALVEVARALAARRTLVVWADDAREDDATAAVVRALWDGPARLLLLVSGLDGLEPDTALHLEPLSADDTRALLADWVGLDAELVAQLASRCEGDVGLAIATVEAGLRSGALVQGARGLHLDTAVLAFPPSARDRWAELATLPEAPLRWPILCAAALGSGVSAETWRRASGAPIEAAAGWLTSRRLLSVFGDGWRWASPIPRQVLLDADPEGARRAHLACATALPEDDTHQWARGRHRIRGGELDAGLREVLAGASHAIASGHMAEGARLLGELEHELETLPLPPEHIAWGALWRSMAQLGPTHQGYDRCWALYDRLLEAADRYGQTHPFWRDLRRDAMTGMVWLANVQFRPDRAAPLLARITEEQEMNGHVWDLCGWHALTVGDAEHAVHCFTQAVELAIAQGNRHTRYVADASLGVARVLAGDPDGIAHLEQAGATMLEAGYVSARADLASALGEAYRLAGDFPTARAHFEEALRAAAEGEARADPGFRLGLALLHRDTGDLDQADLELARCQAQLTDHGPAWEGILALHRASIRVAMGDPAAWDPVAGALADVQRIGYRDANLITTCRLLREACPDPELRGALDRWLSVSPAAGTGPRAPA